MHTMPRLLCGAWRSPLRPPSRSAPNGSRIPGRTCRGRRTAKWTSTAPPRRTADGKIDLSGFWMPTDRVKHLLNLAADLKPGEVPLQPWAAGASIRSGSRPTARTTPACAAGRPGIPEKNNIPDGLKVVQTPDLMIFLHESRTIYRQIFTDGRPLPKRCPADLDGLFGRALGRRHVRGRHHRPERQDLARHARPARHRGAARHRALYAADHRRIYIDVTIDDPKAYTRPWNVRLSWDLQPDTDLIESICEENNRDLPHMVGK